MIKKLVYLHGFASSGASGTVELLRRAFNEKGREDAVQIIAPDLPVDPVEALDLIRRTSEVERPDLVVGTSMGAAYAQHLHGLVRICVNPSFEFSRKTDILSVGLHKWFNRRRDGATTFMVTEETVAHFAEMERHQFEGCTADDAGLCHGLFGDQDAIGLPLRALFEKYYPGMSRVFSGGHRMNADVVNHVLIPYIREQRLI